MANSAMKVALTSSSLKEIPLLCGNGIIKFHFKLSVLLLGNLHLGEKLFIQHEPIITNDIENLIE